MSRIPLLPATSMVAAALVLAACNQPADAPAETASTGETPAAGTVTAAEFEPSINAGDFAAHVERLASDEFAGRAPGSVGEEKTVAYLV